MSLFEMSSGSLAELGNIFVIQVTNIDVTNLILQTSKTSDLVIERIDPWIKATI